MVNRTSVKANLMLVPMIFFLAIEYIFFSSRGTLNSELGQLIPLTTIGVFMGIWNYFHFVSKHPDYGPFGRTPPGAFPEHELSLKYNSKFSGLVRRKFDIYTYRERLFMQNKSPVFSMYGKIPKIYVNEMFFKGSPEPLEDALILHEVGHIRHMDHAIVLILATLFLLSMGALMISLLNSIFYGLVAFNRWFISLSVISSVLSIALLKLQLVIQEPRADHFAAKQMGESTTMIAALNRAYEYVSEHSSSKSAERLARLKKDREKKLDEFQATIRTEG